MLLIFKKVPTMLDNVAVGQQPAPIEEPLPPPPPLLFENWNITATSTALNMVLEKYQYCQLCLVKMRSKTYSHRRCYVYAKQKQ